MRSRTSDVTTAGRSGLELVMSRAATDSRFRRQLLIDPRAAILDAFGVEVPRGLRLRFVEKDRDVDLMLVLPDPIDPGAALDDHDLDPVTGGTAWPWWTGRT